MPTPENLRASNTRVETIVEAIEEHVIALNQISEASCNKPNQANIMPARMDRAKQTRKALADALRAHLQLNHHLVDLSAPVAIEASPRRDSEPFRRPVLTQVTKEELEAPLLVRTCATCLHDLRGTGAPLVRVDGEDSVCVRHDCPSRLRR